MDIPGAALFSDLAGCQGAFTKQTLVGVAWAIMQPLFTMLIFTLLVRPAGRDGRSHWRNSYPIFGLRGAVALDLLLQRRHQQRKTVWSEAPI